MTSILRHELHDKKALSFQRKRCILVKPVADVRYWQKDIRAQARQREKTGKEMNDKTFTIKTMTIEDYQGLYALWKTIRGFGMRSIDDSREGVERFLERNPATSVVAMSGDGEIVGGILCGHDGRRGCLYHVCVREDWRRMGIGKAMVVYCMNALKAEHINKVSLIAFTANDVGNAFWKRIGWTRREDLNYYDFTLNEANITAFNQ
nr:GNAT family N-acetyltransferase [uncultured Acetatifactor sp.]